MASLLSSHLEQISLCANSISSLPFPGPKIFTNALLSPSHDITSLIRDTENHERALFHLATPAIPTKASDYTSSLAGGTASAGQRRATQYQARQPKNKAVAAVLGGDLYQKTRRDGAGTKAKGELDVELLLEGAEKLCGVYPIPEAADRIAALRRRHDQLAANIAHYEGRVSRNAQELQLMNRPSSRGGYGGEEDDDLADSSVEVDDETTAARAMTKEDLQREEEEIRELERKKQGLEDRVHGMSKDLGGLLR